MIEYPIRSRKYLNSPVSPSVYARLFLKVVEKEGVSANEVLEGTGLSNKDLLNSKTLLSIEQLVRIYANIAKASNNPTVGLLQGQQILPHHHGVWGYAMQTAADLSQAIRIFNKYFDVAGPIARQILEIEGETARWISKDVLPREPARRVGVEEMLSGNYTLLKHLSDGNFKLQELRLDYPRPVGYETYEELFQCPVLFDQEFIEMRFDVSMLDLKLIYADEETERVCEQRCQELLDRLGSTGNIVDQVRRKIYECPCDSRDVDTVASKLCMSPRTLRRHLTKENTSFMLVLNEVREALATDYLGDTQLSVDEIAHLLGYSETSNFRRAFKQWTGKNPTSYRNQQ